MMTPALGKRRRTLILLAALVVLFALRSCLRTRPTARHPRARSTAGVHPARALAPLQAHLARQPDAPVEELLAALLRVDPLPSPATVRTQYAAALARLVPFNGSVLYMAVAPVGRAAAPPRSQRQRGTAPDKGPPPSLKAFLDAALGLLAARAGDRLLPCPWDATLPAVGTGAGRVAVSASLRQIGVAGPNMVFQIVKLAQWLPPGSLVVSLYEDGSDDDTRTWLGLLQLLLAPLGTPFNITTAGRVLKRGPGEHRIEHLARVRNAALDPLFPDWGEAAVAASWTARGLGGSAAARAAAVASWRLHCNHMDSMAEAMGCFEPSQILFINDGEWRACGNGCASMQHPACYAVLHEVCARFHADQAPHADRATCPHPALPPSFLLCQRSRTPAAA